MVGGIKGVASQLAAKEKRAVLTHCYGHALNLAVGDSVKQYKVCKDTLYTAYEISKLARYSLASSPGPIFILKLAGQKIGPSSDGQGLCAHALAIHQKLVNRALL